MPDQITVNGQTFALDRLPDSPLLSATLPRFQDAYTSVPEAQWAESDQIAQFNPPMLYQVQNGCVGHAACTAFWVAWVASGLDPLDFSPTWIYAMTNGGRDNGAMIGDVIDALQKHGICLASTFPEDHTYAPAASSPAYAEAALYKLDDAYQIATWEELGTALHKGFQVESSVMVGRDFMNMDADGFVPVDGGPGNHAVFSGGIRRFKGKVGAKTRTSWGPTALDHGNFFIGKDHVLAQSQFSGVVMRTVKPGPGFKPPVVA
jgi:hypothetical protein